MVSRDLGFRFMCHDTSKTTTTKPKKCLFSVDLRSQCRRFVDPSCVIDIVRWFLLFSMNSQIFDHTLKCTVYTLFLFLALSPEIDEFDHKIVYYFGVNTRILGMFFANDARKLMRLVKHT